MKSSFRNKWNNRPYPKHYMRWAVVTGITSALVAVLIVHNVKDAEGVCNASPPDYPGCTIAQVDSIAKNDRDTWIEKRRFGKTNDILAAAGLTTAQRQKVIAATQTEIKQTLIEMRQKAVGQGIAADNPNDESFVNGVWHTSWRGNSYTVDSFPIVKYVGQLYNNPNSADSNCYAQRYTVTYAYGWCGPANVPEGWDNYWGAVAAGLEAYGSAIKINCGWEVIVGTAIGFGTGVFTGPGVGVSTLIGGTGAFVTCAGNQLGKARGW